jgi:hypothetical protein
MTTDTGTGTAREATATAADEGKRVGAVGAEEMQNVASEAKYQARNLVNEAIGQASEQTSTQRDRLVGTLQSLSSDLDQMATSSDSSGLASELARQGAERARALSLRLDSRDPSELLDEVRSFARRRPGMFLLGALAAGVVVGRLVRGAKQTTSTGDAYPRPTDTPSPYIPSQYAPAGAGYDEIGAGDPLAGSPEVGAVGDYTSAGPVLPDDETRITGVRPGAPGGGIGSSQPGTPSGGTT